MRRMLISIQIFILFLLLILLNKYLWVEEKLTLFLLPILFVGVVTIPVSLVIRIFRKINYKRLLIVTFGITSVLQVVMCLFVIWSVHPASFSKEQICTDIDNSIALMEDIHPDLYASIEKDKLVAVIDSIKTQMPAIVSDVEACKIFGLITSQIKDGHTGLAIDNFIKRGSILFSKVPPYSFRIMDDKIYLLKNFYKRKNIPIGSEILTINNKPASQCIDEISRLISYETISFRNAWLQLPINWGVWNDFQDFKIAYKTPDNRIENITTSSGLFANIAYLWDLTAGFGSQKYNFEILDGDIGYINLKAFENLDKFKIFLKSTFHEIKQNDINHLIIDIRNNGGGSSSVSEELMQYISPVEYTTFDTSLLKISNYLIAKYSMDTTKYVRGSLYSEKRDKIPIRDNPLHFNGTCYILTSGYCFSTSLDFPAMVRYYNAGLIVGSETGGRTVSFGSPATVTLPETGIILKVSRKKFVNVGGAKSDRGLIPDHVVVNSIMDDINGVDSVLDSTISLIRERYMN